MRKKKIDLTILTLAVIGSLVFINIIGLAFFGRLDLTAGDEFTLSAATKSTLSNLKDPITVRAYFSHDLPPPYAGNARYVRDILDEYYAHGGGKVRYEFIDPQEAETADDKEKKKEMHRDIFGREVAEPTSVEKELAGLGIPPVQVRVRERDKLEVKNAYMGIAIKYGDKNEAIPVVKDTDGLEYDLTTLIRKMTRDKTPKLALISHLQGQEMQQQYGRMYSMLGQTYTVTTVDLQGGANLDDDVDAIVVLGPETPFSEEQVGKLDAFVSSGRSAAFLLDSVKPDLSTLESKEAHHGLDGLLKRWGVTVADGLVVDSECAPMNVTQQRGFMQVTQAIKYPFIPLPQGLDPKHPLTRGLMQVAFPFMSPITVGTPEGDLKAEVLVSSSEKSWVAQPPFNLDPFQKWNAESLGESGKRPLVITLSGALPGAKPAQSAPVDEAPPAGANVRVLVAGGSSFVNNQFLSRSNEAFVMNLVDWLLLDDALLAIRARGLAAAPIDELSDGTREALKWFNIAGVPIGFALFGLLRWRMREGRRSRVHLATA